MSGAREREEMGVGSACVTPSRCSPARGSQSGQFNLALGPRRRGEEGSVCVCAALLAFAQSHVSALLPTAGALATNGILSSVGMSGLCAGFLTQQALTKAWNSGLKLAPTSGAGRRGINMVTFKGCTFALGG